MSTAAPQTSRLVAAALLVGTLPVAVAIGLGDPIYALDTDAVHLAVGSERFDVRRHEPHPPGYLGYVMRLRLLRAVTDLDPMQGGLWLSRLCSGAAAAAAVWAGWVASRRLDVAVWTVLLTASSPLVLYYALDGQAHPGELLAAVVLMGLAIRLERSPRSSIRDAIAYGFLAGLGGSLRPSLVLVVVLPGLWALRRQGVKGIAAAGVAGSFTTLAWVLPTAHLSGGWSAWREPPLPF